MTKHLSMPLSSRIVWWLLWLLPRAGLIAACLPAAALFLVGLFQLLFGTLRLTLGTLVLFALFPALHTVLSWFALRGDRTVGSTIFRVLLLWVLFCLGGLNAVCFLCLSPKADHRVTRRNAAEAFQESTQYFMELQGLELGEPVSTAFHECSASAPFYHTYTWVLLCGYSEADYAAEKAALEERFPFCSEPLLSHTENAADFSPVVRIGDDVFRFLEPFYSIDDCTMVVTNDLRREIAYVAFSGSGVTDVKDLTSFLENVCCWSFVR